jgi:hypothetical protein
VSRWTTELAKAEARALARQGRHDEADEAVDDGAARLRAEGLDTHANELLLVGVELARPRDLERAVAMCAEVVAHGDADSSAHAGHVALLEELRTEAASRAPVTSPNADAGRSR